MENAGEIARRFFARGLFMTAFAKLRSGMTKREPTALSRKWNAIDTVGWETSREWLAGRRKANHGEPEKTTEHRGREGTGRGVGGAGGGSSVSEFDPQGVAGRERNRRRAAPGCAPGADSELT